TTDRLGTQPWLSWHNEVDDPYLPSRQPLVRYLKDGRIKINRHVDAHLYKDNVFESSDSKDEVSPVQEMWYEFQEEILEIPHNVYKRYKDELNFVYKRVNPNMSNLLGTLTLFVDQLTKKDFNVQEYHAAVMFIK